MSKTGLIGPLRVTGAKGGVQFSQAAATTPASSSITELYRVGTDLYYWNGTGTSKVNSQSTGSTPTGGLDDAYAKDQTITLDDGTIVITDATAGALNSMEFIKSGAGSGNILDFAVNAALTGNVIDIDMNTGLGAKAVYIDGGNGIRTADLIDVKHDGSGNADVMNITATNTGTGAIFDINMDGNGSGAGVFNVDMNAAVGAEFLYLDVGAGARTANLIEIKYDGSGAVDCFAIIGTDTSSGHIFDIDMGGIHTGNVFDVDMNAAVGAKFLYLDAGAGTRTVDLIDVKHDGDGNVDVMNITATNTGTGAIFDINMDGDGSGAGVFNIDMNAALGAEVMNIDAGAGIRTANLFAITHDGAGNVDVFQIDDSNTGTGSVFDINMTGATATGAVINCDMDAAVARPFLTLDYGAGTRTEDVVQVTFDGDGTAPFFDIDITNTGAGGTSDLFDITVDAVYTGSILQVVYGTSAATGDCISIDMGTAVGASAIVLAAAGARTDDLIKIDDASTGNSHIFDINLSDAYTGNVFDVALGSTATGKILAFDMNAGVGATAIYIDGGAGTRTVDMIDVLMDGNGNVGVLDITVTNTGSGNIAEIDIDSVHTGSAFLISYGTGAATGDAVTLTMGTNVAGRAIAITSSATGTSAEGSALDITHDGDLAAGADVVNITSTGSPSSTSNLLAIEQTTGAGTAGAYGLYINCTGTNVEAMKVDAGAVVFDESLTIGTTLGVTGAVTLSSTLSAAATTVTTLLYKDFTEVVAATNVITAGESGSVFFLNHATEFASTLPAPAAGLHYTFVVTGAPSGASYTITTNAAAAVIHGLGVSSADAGGSVGSTAGTPVATITLVDGQAKVGDRVDVFCDGTYWYASAFVSDEDAVTFS